MNLPLAFDISGANVMCLARLQHFCVYSSLRTETLYLREMIGGCHVLQSIN